MLSGEDCVGPVLAHAMLRSNTIRHTADMTMWTGPANYHGGPLSVPCTYQDAISLLPANLGASTPL